MAEIISELDGPLASVRGEPPEELNFLGDAKPLREVWIALRANMREVLESVTIANLVAGELPEPGPQDRQRPGGLTARHSRARAAAQAAASSLVLDSPFGSNTFARRGRV